MGVTQKVGGSTNIANLVGVKEVMVVVCSFETAEQGAVVIPFPFKAKILLLESIVTSTVAGTDAGTITPSNSVGNMANGTMTHATAAAIGDTQSEVPTTNNIIAKDTDLTLTPAKTTAGGITAVTIQYQRIL